MGDSGDVAQWLADHDGVIAKREAQTLGLSLGDIRGRLRRAEWKPLASGVYLAASHPFGEAALVRGAVLAHRGVADRTTAAWWHGLIPRLAAPITLSTTQSPSTERWDRCRVSVVRRSFLAADVASVDGLTMTRKPLTVLLASAQVEDGARLIDRSLQTRAVTVRDLRDALDRNTGRRGIAKAREWLQIAAGDTESEAERLFARLLREAGITGWVCQLPFGPWSLDFAWPEQRVAVEIDGWAFHSSHDRFRADRRKGNALQTSGWRRLSFTWHDLIEDPIGCIRKVAALLSEDC
ncbi:MAG: DUF559 domain-containing protein [Gordonia sp. (in: high G+C Gram-positive bacteria)]|uniref:DUF559 domain-containing protein n=1 Tax=Gordonia sp. (in: high G+C Gram-positive bacteria) TaxID=84139 RepID=UPI0039E55921